MLKRGIVEWKIFYKDARKEDMIMFFPARRNMSVYKLTRRINQRLIAGLLILPEMLTIDRKRAAITVGNIGGQNGQ